MDEQAVRATIKQQIARREERLNVLKSAYPRDLETIGKVEHGIMTLLELEHELHLCDCPSEACDHCGTTVSVTTFAEKATGKEERLCQECYDVGVGLGDFPVKGLKVGRVVHYVGKNGVHVTAIVGSLIDEKNGVVNLQAFQTDDLAFAMGRTTEPISQVKYSEGKEPETWHWIEEGWIPQ